MVPNHFPKRIPEISKIGDPKPNKETQTTQKIKKIKHLNKYFD